MRYTQTCSGIHIPVGGCLLVESSLFLFNSMTRNCPNRDTLRQRRAGFQAKQVIIIILIHHKALSVLLGRLVAFSLVLAILLFALVHKTLLFDFRQIGAFLKSG